VFLGVFHNITMLPHFQMSSSQFNAVITVMIVDSEHVYVCR